MILSRGNHEFRVKANRGCFGLNKFEFHRLGIHYETEFCQSTHFIEEGGRPKLKHLVFESDMRWGAALLLGHLCYDGSAHPAS